MVNPQRICAVLLLGMGVVITTSPSVWAQSKADPRIDRIRKQCEAIDSPSRHYTIRKQDNDYKNSHDSFTGFYRGKELRKIVVVSSTERSRDVVNIYQQSRHIFFVRFITTKFSGPADSKGTSSEERYYFAQDRLIRWLGPGNTAKPTSSAEARGAVNAVIEWRTEAVAALALQQ